MDLSGDMTSQFNPAQEKKNKLKKLFFLEVGLLEIGSVLIVLAFIFFLLNFLNILYLDKVFPHLSFLPHLAQRADHAKLPVTPKPAPLSDDYFIQNTKSALPSILAELIHKQYVPSEKDQMHTFFKEQGRLGLVTNSFGSAIPFPLMTIKTYYTPSHTTSPAFVSILFAQTTLATVSATQSVQQHFINSPSTFTCSNIAIGSICTTTIEKGSELTMYGYLQKDNAPIGIFVCKGNLPAQQAKGICP